MLLNRRSRLHTLLVLLFFTALTGYLQGQSPNPQQPPQPPASPPPQQKPPEQKPPEQKPPQTPAPRNPFENVPQSTQPPAQQPPPRLQPPTTPAQPPAPAPRTTSPGAPPENIVEAIDFRGTRRVPQDTLRAQIVTKKGDQFNEDILRRDFMVLWNTNKFDDIRLEREAGQTGWIIRFVMP